MSIHQLLCLEESVFAKIVYSLIVVISNEIEKRQYNKRQQTKEDANPDKKGFFCR